MEALAVLIDGAEVPVQGGLVALRPSPLSGGTATLEHVLELLCTGTPAEDGLAQGELRRQTPGSIQAEAVTIWRLALALGATKHPALTSAVGNSIKLQ